MAWHGTKPGAQALTVSDSHGRYGNLDGASQQMSRELQYHRQVVEINTSVEQLARGSRHHILKMVGGNQSTNGREEELGKDRSTLRASLALGLAR